MRDALLTAALAPVLLPQGLWTRWRTPKLAEPPGARRGRRGSGAPLRLLVAGDSAAAGVGAASQDEALLGCLVGRLAAAREVHFALEAKTGATTAATIQRLQTLPAEHFDVAVLSLGVNDLVRIADVSRWLSLQAMLWSVLKSRFGVRQVIASGLPPVHAFPALPQPLRWYLGARATRYDAALARAAAAADGVDFLDLRFTGDVGLMATDGFHPGPGVYAQWAELAADAILARDGGPR